MKHVTLTAEDFTFQYDENTKLLGMPIGEDDYFVLYGHDVTDEEAVDEAVRYFRVAQAFVEEREYEEFRNDLLEYGVKRVWAEAFVPDDSYDDEWIMTWDLLAEADSDRIPVTVVAIQ